MNNLMICLYSGSQNSDSNQMLVLGLFNAGGDDELGRIVSSQRYTEAIYCKQGPASVWASGTFCWDIKSSNFTVQIPGQAPNPSII